MINTERLMLYKNFVYNEIFYGIADIINACLYGDGNLKGMTKDETIAKAYTYVNELIEVTDKYGLEGNLYHSFLAFLLANNENAFSMSCEKIGEREGSINAIALNDFQIFIELFNVDLIEIDKKLNGKCFGFLVKYKHKDGNSKVFNKRIRDRICELAKKLSNWRLSLR